MFLLIDSISSRTQSTVVCPTGTWNSTYRTLAGTFNQVGSSSTLLYYPYRAAFDASNTMYVADQYNQRILKYVGGSTSGTAVTGLSLSYPTDVYVDNTNIIYILDTNNYRVLRWNSGVVTVVAGGRGAGSTYDKMSTSYSMFIDSSSNIYVSDYGNHRVVLWSAGNPNMSQLVAGGYGAGGASYQLYYPFGIYVDSARILYVADCYNHRIEQWYPGAAVGNTVAGQSGVSGSWSYQLSYPTSVIYDQYNYLYILDGNNDRVQRWVLGATYGITVAATSMSSPRGLTFDSFGNIVIADSDYHRIISYAMYCPQATMPVCSTAVWNQSFTILAGSSGNAGASSTYLYYPYSSFIDIYGNLYVVDYYNHRIQYFLRGVTTGTTVAGITSSAGSSYSQLYYPSDIYVDSNGIMYILDTTNCRILQWIRGQPLGFVIAGGHGCGSALTQIDTSYSMFIDNQYNIYISEYANHRVTLWSPTNTTAGTLIAGGYGAGSTSEKLYYPWGLYVDSNQAVYVADRSNHRVQLWNSESMSGITVAGLTGSSGPWSYQLSNPTGVTLDPYGYIYVLDTGNSRVQKWFPDASYGTTVISASMNSPYGFMFDLRGNIVITDTSYHRILSFAMTCPNATTPTTTTVSPPTTPQASLCPTAQWNQTLSILAGTTSSAGTSPTLLYYPYNIYFDGYQNLYVADTTNHRIQYFPRGTTTGITVAGSSGNPGSAYAQFNNPYAIYVDSNRVMYILDTSNYRVIQWKFGDPYGDVVVGGNGAGSALTQITTSYAMFVDSQSNIYVSEYSNHRVTLWLSTNTTAGTLVAGGNGAGSTPERLYNPWGIYVDSNRAMYIVDRTNHRVQLWLNGAISGDTVAGTTGDAGPWAYQLNYPTSLLLDQYGYVYILDYNNNRIQKWFPGALYGTTVISASFYNPCGMQFDRLNNLVVADTYYHRIVSFGVFCPATTTTTTAPPTSSPTSICATAQWNQTFSILAGITSSIGTTPTLLYNPCDAALDGYQNLYVADTTNHRIQYFPRGTTTGITVAGKSGSAGSAYAQLNNPHAIYVDSNRVMYILDTSNYRVLQWQFGEPFGHVVAGGNGAGSALTQITTSYAMFVDSQSNIYVSEYGNHRVTLWLSTNTTSGTLVAGGNGAGSTSERLYNPWGIYVNVNGSMYICDTSNHRVQLWQPGAISGSTVAGATSDPGPNAYQLNTPTGITVDPYGYIYVLDTSNSRVQKWFPGASYGITVIATSMNTPYGLHADNQGNLVVTDTYNYRILSFAMTCPGTTTTTTAPPFQGTVPVCSTAVWNQTYSTLVGTFNTYGSTATLLYNPSSIAFDGYGYMYIADISNHRIQRYPQGSNIGTTVAGATGSWGSSRAQLYNPHGLHVTNNGTMFILDTSNYRVLRWQLGYPMGYIVAGGNGGGAAYTQIGASYAIFVDDQYNIYISESGNHRITKWISQNTTAGALVAGGNGAGSTADKLSSPWGIFIINNSTYIVDQGNHRVQRWDFGASLATTVAGSTSDPGPWAYQFNTPTSITLDPYGYIYILDSANDRLQKWYPGASYGITVVSATMYGLYSMQFDHSGNIVISDTFYHRVLSFTSPTTTTTLPPTQTAIPVCQTAIWNQTFTILAGTTSNIGSTPTLLYYPYDVTFDGYGNMYVADYYNHRIQRFSPGSNAGTTVAGSSGSAGSSRSQLRYPSTVFVSTNQDMYILDTNNYRVLKWQLGEPLGYIVAGGNGNGAGFTQIGASYALFVDSNYSIYISEQTNHRVTKWSSRNISAGILVVGGNGAGNTADKLNSPWGVYVDGNETIFVVDRGNHRVQRWDAGASLGTTIAGSTSDAGPWSYQFNNPTSITFDPYGYMYILDYSNNRVQKWYPGSSYGTTVASGSMNLPVGMSFDRLGNLVVADTSYHRIISFSVMCPSPTTTTTALPFSTTSPLCSTVVWNQTMSIIAGTTSNAGTTSILLYNPYDIDYDGYGNLYVVDYSNHRIQRFPPGSSNGTTVAGVTSSWGSSRAQLYYPTSISVTQNETMFIMDTSNYRVLRWVVGDPLGYIVAGGNGGGGAYTQIGASYELFVDNQFNVYVSENSNHRITKWFSTNPTNGLLIAGGNGQGNAVEKLDSPWGIYIDNTGGLYIVDRNNHRVQYWPFGASFGTTVAGSTSDAGPWSYQFNSPTSITLDIYGYIYVMDFNNERIQKWFPGASFGFTVAATNMYNPYGMTMDPHGNLIVADTSYHRIISFSPTCPAPTTTTPSPGTQATVPLCPTAIWNSTFTIAAGSTSSAGSTSILLYYPYDIDYDGYGNLYVVDCYNHRIQKYPFGLSNGTTVAGVTSSLGSSRSQLYYPTAISITSNGSMFILDTSNYRVLKWQVGDTLGYIVAGGNGGGGAYTQIGASYGIVADDQYNIYISEQTNHRVTKWFNGNTTVGTLVAGGNGAGNTAEKLNSPWGIYVDNTSGIYIVDRGNHRVQYWSFGASFGTTVAGSTSDAGSWSYQFNNPTSITLDQYGYMYICDYSNNRVQKWYPGSSYGTTVVSGSMNLPIGLKFDRLGNLVVADTSYHRVISFSVVCAATTTTTTLPPPQTQIPLCSTAIWNSTFTIVAGATSSSGSTSILLSYPYGIAFDAYGYFYVADYNNHRIQRFRQGSNIGTTVAGFNPSSGSGRSELNSPSDVYIDSNETMYILDTYNYRILKWQVGESIGTTIVNGRGSGSTFDKIGRSHGFFIDNDYNIYVSEYVNHRVTLWFNGNNTVGLLVAGGNGLGNAAEKLNSPWGIYVDNTNGIYIVDRGNHRVQYWPSGASLATTVAGSTSDPGSWSYQFNNPSSIMLDPYGYIYVLDTSNARVQKWYPGDPYGRTILSATMSSPIGMSLDFSGNLFIADTSYHRILSFNLLCPLATTTTTTQPPTSSQNQICATAIWNQTLSVLAGTASSPGSTSTLLYNPSDIYFDAYGNMYIADRTNHRIQVFRSGQTTGTTVAGNSGSSGYGRSELYNPYGIFVSSNQTMFILDTTNYRVLKWQLGEPIGYVVAGGNGAGSALTQIGASYSFFVDDQYNVYVSENGNHRVTVWFSRNITAGALVAGGSGVGNADEKLNSPWGVYVDSNQTVYVVDRGNHRVQRWYAGSSTGVTVAGSTSNPGSWSYQLNSPASIILDPYGYLYVLDSGNARVQKWFPGDSYGRTILSATMNNPLAIKIDLFANLVIADTSYHRILSFGLVCPGTTTTTSAPPTVTTIPLCSTATWNSTSTIAAGTTSTIGSSPTLLYYPFDVAFDAYNYMYVVDCYNHRIQRFPPGSNTGVTVAGSTGSLGSSFSQLYYPTAISITSNGTMFILDTSNYRVLKWKLGEPIGFIVAGGNGNGAGFNQIGASYGIVVDDQYNIYISDQTNHRVTKWFNGNTTVGTLVAGGNGAGTTPEKLNSPWGIYVDSNNSIYIADRSNHRIQRWDLGAANGITVAGDMNGNAGSLAYQLNSPTGIIVDQHGFIYILDLGNSRIQKWAPGATFGTTVLTGTFSNPYGMDINAYGNLFIADTYYHRIQSFSVYCPITTTTNIPLSTQTSIPLCSTAIWNSTSGVIAGTTGSSGSSPTLLSSPYDVTFDRYQQMYVADYGNHRIQQYTFGSNVGRTIAGITSNSGSTLGQLSNPSAIYIDSNDNMYILDTSNYRILQWQLGNQLGTIVVNGRGSGTTLDKIGISYAMFVFNQTYIYVSEYGNHRVTKWTISNNNIGQLMAGGAGAGNTPERLNGPWGIYVDYNGILYVVDRSNQRIQQWVYESAVGITIAGESGVSGPWSYQFNNPTSITFDQYGYMYILDSGNTRIQKWLIGMAYGVTVISGSMSSLSTMHWDFSNNIFIADISNHRITSFNILCPPTTTATAPYPTLSPNLACQTGVYNTSWSVVAGVTSTSGTTSTNLNNPYDMFIDGNFNTYIADYGNSRIQKFQSGVVSGSTVAGYTLTGGSSYSQLYNPTSIFVDLNGAMYIADANNYRILKWLPNQPLGSIVAGGRGNGSTLDKIGFVYSIFVDNQGNMYLSEYTNHRVTLWLSYNTSLGQLVAGVGFLGNSSIHLNNPWGVHVDSNDTLYVVDRGNHRVQQWIKGYIFGITIAGITGTSGSSSSLLNSPTAITFDSNNFMYIMDAGNNRIQRFALGSATADTIVSMAFSSPKGMRLDTIGNLYIADQNNHRIVLFRCVYNVSTTTLTTVTTTTGPTTSTTTTTRTTSTTSSSTSSTTATTTTSRTTTSTTSSTTSTTTSSTTTSTTSVTTSSTTSSSTSSTTETTTTGLSTTSVTTTTGPPTTTVTTTTATTSTGPPTTTVTTTTGPSTTTVITTTLFIATTTTSTSTTSTTTTPASTTTISITVTTSATSTAALTTTTIVGATTTTGATTITTTVAGTTATTALGATTTTGATTITTPGSGGSVGSTTTQSAGTAIAASSQSSSNIGVIVGSAVGGAVALAAIVGIGVAIAKKLKEASSLANNQVISTGTNNIFTTMERIDNPSYVPPTDQTASSNIKTLEDSSSNRKSNTGPISGTSSTQGQLNTRTYNIRIVK
ncbi:unnamed protein product [Rotaria sordida]|uniref:Uncharacterized protein n=1 Tax=Rotaria sordida TaxID=392033 RepID=A0A814MPX9_9BILA|nr:unnamed protein product [Rotaria sordida]